MTNNGFKQLNKVLKEVPKGTLESLIEKTLDEHDVEKIITNTIQDKDKELLERLIDARIDINKKIVGKIYRNYLDYAVRYGTPEIVELLIEKGAEIQK